MAKYLFRIDDTHPRMDWDRFNRLRKIFDEYQIKPLLAVIPDNQCKILDKNEPRQNFWEEIEKLSVDGWMIAMHGYQHKYVNNQSGMLKINPFGEFAGLSYLEQSAKIQQGKKILNSHGITTDIFIAPAHSFDINTIKALKDNGFQYISDGIALWPFRRYDIVWIPQVFGNVRTFPIGLLTFCLHINTISEADIKKLLRFITRHRKSIINFPDLIDIINKIDTDKRFLILFLNIIFGTIIKITFRLRNIIFVTLRNNQETL